MKIEQIKSKRLTLLPCIILQFLNFSMRNETASLSFWSIFFTLMSTSPTWWTSSAEKNTKHNPSAESFKQILPCSLIEKTENYFSSSSTMCGEVIKILGELIKTLSQQHLQCIRKRRQKVQCELKRLNRTQTSKSSDSCG